MVVTSSPSAWTASIVHDFTDSPSRRTVHAPHDDVSQPTFVPVSPQDVAEVVHEERAGLDVVLPDVPLTVTATFTSASPNSVWTGAIMARRAALCSAQPN